MSFTPCDITLSKSEIVQVAPISRQNYQSDYEPKGFIWVLLENHKKHWDTEDCVKSANDAGDYLYPKMGRTKYKMNRRDTVNGVLDHILVNDNSYCEFVVGGRVVAYYWDKPAVKRGMEKVLDLYQKAVDKAVEKDTEGKYDEYPYNHPVTREFHFTRDFIVYCRDNFAFPPGAVVVRMENHPMKRETYTIRAYAPIRGYWASHPTIAPTSHGKGYDLEFLINNTKTDQCHQFLEWNNLNYSGAFGNSGHIHYRLEETGRPLKIHQLPTEYPPTSRYQLSDCDWVVTKKEHSPPTERTTIRRTDRTKPLTALNRLAFAKELSEKVFHPDRVARFMGDTWGTDDSWLAKVM